MAETRRLVIALILAVLTVTTVTVVVLARSTVERGPTAGPTGTVSTATTGAGAPSTVSAAPIMTSVPTGVAVPTTSATGARALTPRQRAGQRIIYSYPGLTPPARLLQLIGDGEAAGVIFFGENISGTAQIASVIRQLRQAQQRSPVRAPLLLMTDQEGGQIRRLPGQPILSEKQIGQSSSPAARATQAGEGAATALRAVGMNVNLAPVLDVYYSAGNAVDLFQRSYSSDANTVATLGADFITAQQREGVSATAKHFPGLGSMARGQNTDTGPVTITIGRSDLRGRDEVPYSAAIAAGVTLVMVSWAVYPAFDPFRPAGLAPNVVRSELRGRLRFTGVTITDALEAGALEAFGTTGQRAVLAAEAGMDLILCSAREVGQGQDAAEGLATALAGGRLDPSTFQAALDRISALRSIPR